MPFIPHSETEIQQMLGTIGVDSVEQLFDEIPTALRCPSLAGVPEGISEQEMVRQLARLAAKDDGQLNFIGAGCYQHHIPAAVWELVGRGEYMTAYTPYQAEASQGGLQLLYEYQTMMASLMGMDIANASMYEGASGLAESMLMAVRANKKAKSKRILVLGEIAPAYRQVVKSITQHQQLAVTYVDFAMAKEAEIQAALAAYEEEKWAAVVIAQPNFIGRIQAVDHFVDWAHQQGALAIALVNPLAMALLKPPGQWGETGADIACGEGQPLGVPMASGGPFFGFLCCRKAFVRQMPGRLVGKTVDEDGQVGYSLTLQGREQHIRRSKATSNICTNQGLLVTAATIYMSIMGPNGLRQAALTCHQNALALSKRLAAIDGVTVLSSAPFFHEFIIQLELPVTEVLSQLADHNIQAGFDVSEAFPGLGNALLVCSTEVHMEEDHQQFCQLLDRVITEVSEREMEAC